MTESASFRLVQVTLDERMAVRRNREIEREREVAVRDLLQANFFRPEGSDGGPYHLTLGAAENRLVFDISRADGHAHDRMLLPLAPFRRIIKDYFLVCESYFRAVRDQPAQRIETLDMGRRSLHDEGATLLGRKLEGRIEVDFDTARRLFTLICVLHMKG